MIEGTPLGKIDVRSALKALGVLGGGMVPADTGTAAYTALSKNIGELLVRSVESTMIYVLPT